jgi:hypothetical protein
MIKRYPFPGCYQPLPGNGPSTPLPRYPPIGNGNGNAHRGSTEKVKSVTPRGGLIERGKSLMTWRGPRTPNDPVLTSHHWRTVVRPYWQRRRLPCSRCGCAIDYDGPRYLTTPSGKRAMNPRALVVGHIVSRYAARRAGWTEAEINALSNTQPECQACSNRSGARLGQRVRSATSNAPVIYVGRW